MQNIMGRIGLQVNHDKTHVVNLLAKEQFDFLGYTIGKFFNRDCAEYYGTRPSKKALKSVIRKIHDETSRRWLVNKYQFRGTTGYRQFPDEYRYGKLGLYEIATVRADVPRAKV